MTDEQWLDYFHAQVKQINNRTGEKVHEEQTDARTPANQNSSRKENKHQQQKLNGYFA